MHPSGRTPASDPSDVPPGAPSGVPVERRAGPRVLLVDADPPDGPSTVTTGEEAGPDGVRAGKVMGVVRADEDVCREVRKLVDARLLDGEPAHHGSAQVAVTLELL